MRFSAKTLVGVVGFAVITFTLVRLDSTTTDRTFDQRVNKRSEQALREGRREIEYCPYYPNNIQDIVTRIFEWETLVEIRTQVGRFKRGSPIHLLVANENVLAMLSNWLCASRRHLGDLDSVLVVAPPGDSMASLLRSKGMRAVQMNYSPWCVQKMSRKMREFMLPIAARVLTIMLLTHWGYDVAVYDPDAFLTSNPTEAYMHIVKELKADAIFQKGRFPPPLGKMWGFTVCCGAAYYRGSAKLDILWKMMAEIQQSWEGDKIQLNDQLLTNYALKELEVNWSKTSLFDSHVGTTKDHGPIVVALGKEYSRRTWPSNDDLNNELISHPQIGHTLETKVKQLRKHKMWYLSKEPSELNDEKIYKNPGDWLQNICVPISD